MTKEPLSDARKAQNKVCAETLRDLADAVEAGVPTLVAVVYGVPSDEESTDVVRTLAFAPSSPEGSVDARMLDYMGTCVQNLAAGQEETAPADTRLN